MGSGESGRIEFSSSFLPLFPYPGMAWPRIRASNARELARFGSSQIMI